MSTPATPSPSTIYELSDLSQDFDQFVNQFQNYLQTTPGPWQGNLTTQTSQTLIEYISTVGTLNQGRIIRAYEDAYAETAQSNDAILSIAQMQGLRLSRYLPASAPATMVSDTTVSLAPLTQFTCGGNYFYNNEALTFQAGVSTEITLFQGQVYSYVMNGIGQERQSFVAPQTGFVISDQDVWVQVNSVFIPKSYGNLWNYDGLPAFADLTLSDGRLVVQFGNLGGVNGQFGTIPQTNDTVVVSFPVTLGASGNSLTTINSPVNVSGFTGITGTMTGNPSGGANNQSIIAYKNVASGSFGTYSSAVTKNQYTALVATYPGVVDAVTQAQREIDPGDVRWMNVVRVSALTTSPWSQAQITAFLAYCQSISMYAVYFLWQEAIAVPNNVDIDVYIYNSAVPSQVQQNATTAITNLFAPRPGILMTNFYPSDLVEAIYNSSPGLISYVNINSPTEPMIVTSPTSPQITYTLTAGGGSLGELVYAYSVSTTVTYPDGTTEVGYPSNWVFPQVISNVANYAIELEWPSVLNAVSYQVWGRSASSPSGLGLLATVTAVSGQATYTWTDNGSVTPSGSLPTSQDFPIQYNSLNSLTINVYYSERQQRQLGEDPTRLLGG
jgi:hypothetical protein